MNCKNCNHEMVSISLVSVLYWCKECGTIYTNNSSIQQVINSYWSFPNYLQNKTQNSLGKIKSDEIKKMISEEIHSSMYRPVYDIRDEVIKSSIDIKNETLANARRQLVDAFQPQLSSRSYNSNTFEPSVVQPHFFGNLLPTEPTASLDNSYNEDMDLDAMVKTLEKSNEIDNKITMKYITNYLIPTDIEENKKQNNTNLGYVKHPYE